MKPLAPNTILQNRYKITEMIGKGGMGEVYLAIDQRLGHSIALKRTTVGDDLVLTEAFEREAKTLAQLRHSVLPKVSDHFRENDEQYLIMEYISGEDLSDRLKATNKAFPLNWVMFWADQLLEALTFLHSQNPPIIHRDIKPQNLKLTSENHIVLLDFGLAKNTLEQTRATTSGSVVGYTPHYASMEQIRGTGTNPRSDIFSLSATLYQLVSNEVPPDALTRADVMLSGMPDPIKPLTVLNPEMSETISDAILKGLEISQEKRFKTAREMQKILRRAYNDMQNSMSANTVAFNLDNAAVENIQVGEKTEVIENLPSIANEQLNSLVSNELEEKSSQRQESLDPTLIGGYRGEDISSEKTEMIDSSEIKEFVISDSAKTDVQYEGRAEDIPTEESASMQTEVISGDILQGNESSENFATETEIPAAVPLTSEFKTNEDVSVSAGEYKTNENFATSEEFVPESFKTSENVQEVENFSPELKVFNEANFEPEAVSNYESEQNIIDESEVAFSQTDDFSSVDVEEIEVENDIDEDIQDSQINAVNLSKANESSTIPPKAKEKSSVGKYIAILGGLGAVLLLLLGSVFAFGWYYTNGTFSFGADNNSSASNPETEVTPQSDTNVDSNSEVADTTDETTGSNNEDVNTETSETDTNSDNSEDAGSDTTPPAETKTDNGSKTQTTVTTRPPTKTTNKPSVKTTKKPPTKTTKIPPTKNPPETKPTRKKKDAGVL